MSSNSYNFIVVGSSLFLVVSLYLYLLNTVNGSTNPNSSLQQPVSTDSGNNENIEDGTIVVELQLPVGERSILQHIMNDETIVEALKGLILSGNFSCSLYSSVTLSFLGR